MKRFIQGEHRGQSTLLPESLDNYVSDTNPVRVVDVFVDELDLGKRGFEGVIPAKTRCIDEWFRSNSWTMCWRESPFCQ
jgi:hypothetical protein